MTNRIESSIAQLRDVGKIPGLQVAVIEKDKGIWTKGFGFKNQDKQTPVDETTMFEAASLTKPLTAYLIMKLVDEGIFDLYKSVLEYLSDDELEAFIGHPMDLIDGLHQRWAAKINGMHLMSHQAGIPEEIGKTLFVMLCEPGIKETYSPAGFKLLHKIAEKLTGKKLEVLFDEYIFKPLKMRNSWMGWKDEFVENIAQAHDMFGNPKKVRKHKCADAAASLLTTAYDYALFLDAVMRGTGFSEEAMEEFLRPRTLVDDKLKIFWALAFGIQQDPTGPGIWQCGNLGYFRSYFIAYPEEELGIVYMTNSFNGHSICEALTDLTIGKDTRGMDPAAFLQYDSLEGQFCRALIEHGLEANSARLEALKTTHPAQFNRHSIRWLAYHFLDAKRFEEGISLLKSLEQEMPHSASICYELTKAYLEWGDMGQAEKYRTKTRELSMRDHHFDKALLDLVTNYIKAIRTPIVLDKSYLLELAGAYGDRIFTVIGKDLYFAEDYQDIDDLQKMVPLSTHTFALESGFEFRIQFVLDKDGKPTKAIGLHGNSYQTFTLRNANQDALLELNALLEKENTSVKTKQRAELTE